MHLLPLTFHKQLFLIDPIKYDYQIMKHIVFVPTEDVFV